MSADAMVPPPAFRRAVASLQRVRPRSELRVTAVAAPRIAAHSFAFGVETVDDDPMDTSTGTVTDAVTDTVTDAGGVPETSGRLILLHDPAGQRSWHGTFRLVCLVQARLDRELLGDAMLPAVGWSWLTEALDGHGAAHIALGGTVTQTSSVRFGDIAGSPQETDIELRASWTPAGEDMGRHAEAFCAVVATAAGLPPVGVERLARRTV